MGTSFSDAFRALTDAPSPFPWQERLYERFVANNLPDCLDIPTGLGKTSVMAIWLLARMKNDKLPRRLVYVVNRRAIVDQASDVAKEFREHEPFTNLSISTLRGALADNREWLRYPHRPTIIVGTVDMIGSRLLFDAYRAGKWTKAMHAGLLGQDSLIVHDEAHLSDAFQKAIDWIANCQSKDGSPKPMRVLAMSATGTSGAKSVHRIEDDDRALDAVKKRIHSLKRLRVQDVDAKKLADELASRAFAYDGDNGSAARRIIVFVREPKTAQDVIDRLKRVHKVEDSRTTLLTGTIRGEERDRLVDKPPLRHLLDATRPEKTIYLVSTSAGEVGADFDADHLVCDISTLDAMIQRLGRVNRRGNADSRVDVFVDLKTAKGDQQERIVKTAQWLRGLPAIDGDTDGRLNASPETLGKQRTGDEGARAAYLAAASKAPVTVEPHPATLDAWALTSIQDEWPIAAPLDVYLHGISEYEPARTSLAWRDELSLFFPVPPEGERPDYDCDAREAQFEKWIEFCPLRPREVVTDKSRQVIELMTALAAAGHREALFAALHRGEVKFETIGHFVERSMRGDGRRFEASIADQTFILPTEVGGLDGHGMLDESATGTVTDVADAFDEKREADAMQWRGRLWLGADDNKDLTPHWLDIDAPPETTTSWTEWRDAALGSALLKGMHQAFHLRLNTAEDGLSGHLLLFKPKREDNKDSERLPLTKHNADAAKKAEEFSGELVDAGLFAAIKLAAGCHDYGKHRERWQASIGNPKGDEPLAKSFGNGMNVDRLGGYRHEFGSLIDLTNTEKAHVSAEHREAFEKLGENGRDVCLHLIAAHHGRGRPFFPDGAFDPDLSPPLDVFDVPISPGEIARRYARLQRRFGHWGLAWLESLIMCADHAASRGEEPEDTQ